MGRMIRARFATLRLTWEPRMLSILRIVVGLLFMEHGSQRSWISRISRTTRLTPCSP
jgi:uncharacterized membrane protein YphA (DoxX/SURF4 family)